MPKKQEKAAASEKKKAVKKEAGTEEVSAAPTKAAKAPRVSAKAKREAEAAATALEEANQKWLELKDKFSGQKPLKYSMEKKFESNQPIEHPVLGWGFVVNNINDRLEVLFKDGVRVLISNYTQR